MAKKKKQLSKSLRDKISKDEERRQARSQKQSSHRANSSSSDRSTNLFEGYGLVSLEEKGIGGKKPSGPLISAVISEAKTGKIARPKGLTNLGNTCYFNSVMQVLSQTPLLKDLLDNKLADGISWTATHNNQIQPSFITLQTEEGKEQVTGSDKFEPLLTTLPDAGTLPCSFARFLREMQVGNSSNVTPNSILNEVGRKCPQFRGRDQQDSHELLRNLLDAVKTDEIRRQRKAILTAFSIDNSNNANVDDDTKTLIKGYGHASNFTSIDRAFGGYIISSVKCEECEESSQILEPFFDLSLPVSEGKQKHEKSISIGKKKGKAIKGSKEEEPDTEALNLIDSDVGKLSVKSRKQRRAVKNASKRVERSNKKTKSTTQNNSPNCDQGGDEGAGKVSEADMKTDDEDHLVHSENDKAVATTPTPATTVTDSAPEIKSFNIDVNVTVSPGKVDVQVDIKNKGNDEVNCNVAVQHTNDSGNKRIECKLPKDEGGGTENSIHQETVDLSVSDLNELSSIQESLPCDADSEGEGISDEERGKNVDKVALTVENLKLNEEDSLLALDTSCANRVRTVSQSCCKEDLRSKKNWCLSTLAAKPEQPSGVDGTPTLESCLSAYTLPEILAGSNKLFCENCTENSKKNGGDKKVYTNASKQMLIAYPPPILTLHLKRFQAEGYRCVSLRKLNRFVAFPMTLDLSSWTSPLYKFIAKEMGIEEKTNNLKYRLFGIVQHSGSLRSGHYTAFVNLRKQDSANLEKILRFKPFIHCVEKLLENIFIDEDTSAEALSDIDSKCDGDKPPVKSTNGNWFHISDSHVATVNEQSVKAAQAYILFYERDFSD